MGNVELLKALKKIKNSADEAGVKFWLLGALAHAFHVGKLYREFGDLDLVVKSPEDQKKFFVILESVGFEKVGEKKLTDTLTNFIFKNDEGVEVDIGPYVKEFGLTDEDFEEDEKKLDDVLCRVVSRKFLVSFKKYLMTKRDMEKDALDLDILE